MIKSFENYKSLKKLFVCYCYCVVTLKMNRKINILRNIYDKIVAVLLFFLLFNTKTRNKLKQSYN